LDDRVERPDTEDGVFEMSYRLEVDESSLGRIRDWQTAAGAEADAISWLGRPAAGNRDGPV
jgi:hypothetical protein